MIDVPEAPVLQAYVPPPLAVNVDVCPAQIVLVPLIAAMGAAFTVTETEPVAEHPLLFVTVMVYVVLLVGETVPPFTLPSPALQA
jgi:hypothetical protein